MKNIWLQRREISNYKKKQRCIHELLSPITHISDPLSNCVLWESKDTFERFPLLKKHGVKLVYLFIKSLKGDFASSLTLPSYVKFDFAYDNKLLVVEDGVEELWEMEYEDLLLKTPHNTDDDISKAIFHMSQSYASDVKQDILDDIALIKNNNVVEYTYYINSFQVVQEDFGDFLGKQERMYLKFAKSVVLRS